MEKYRKVIICIIIVITLFGAGSLYYTKIYADPFNRSLAALLNMVKVKNEEITCDVKISLLPEGFEETFGITMDEEDKNAISYINAIMESSILKIGYKSEINKEKLLDSKIQYSLDWLYDDERLLDFMVKMDEELLEILAPSLLDQTFYMTKTELYDELGYDLTNFELEKYLKIIEDQKALLKKIDKKIYIDILRERFEEKIIGGDRVSIEVANGKNIPAKEYTILIHYNDIVSIFEEFKTEVRKEKVFKEFLRETMLKMAKEAHESLDYKIFYIEEKTLREMISNFEDQEKFEIVFEEMMKELDELFEELRVIQQEMNMDYKLTYAIDMKNEIRRMNMDMDYRFLKLRYEYIFHSINKEVDFDMANDAERVHVMKIADMDEDQVNELFYEIIMEAKNKMTTNKVFRRLVIDMKKNSHLLSESYKAMLGSFLEGF